MVKSFKDLFDCHDNKSYKWQKEFFEAMQNNNQKRLQELQDDAKEMYLTEGRIYSAIDKFTKKTILDEEKEYWLNSLKKIDSVENIVIGKSKVEIYTEKGTVKVYKLSDVIEVLKDDPDIETDNRKGMCHNKTIDISEILSNPHNVVTGYVYGISDKVEILHSWIETIIDGEEYVMDYTDNIVMNKEGYYYIKHAKPLSIISNKDLEEDHKILDELTKRGIVFDLKEYLLFRDEIMTDLKKNKQLFQEDEER